jgi:hypothetical protein
MAGPMAQFGTWKSLGPFLSLSISFVPGRTAGKISSNRI